MTSREANMTAAALQNLFFRPLRGGSGWLVYLAVVALFVPAYFRIGEALLRQTNGDSAAHDQLANIQLARESAGDWFPRRSTYIQPLWPWVSRVVLEKNDEDYFRRGRQLNLAIGCVATIVVFIFGAALVAPVPGYMMGLIAGFGVFLQRAHFFHPEPLLYCFFTGCALLMTFCFLSNRWWFYAGWGICFGLADLAKASVSPLLAVYIFATIVLLLTRGGFLPRRLVSAGGVAAWSPGQHLFRSAVAILFAAAIIAPNALFKQRVHGDPFFSPTKYWMWCDDWETEAQRFYGELWTADSRARLGAGELPSAGNYFRKHGWAHAGERLIEGLGVTAERFVLPLLKVPSALFWMPLDGNAKRGDPDKVWIYMLPARGLYLVLLFAVVLFLWIDRRFREGAPLFRGSAGLASFVFVVSLLLGYWLAFGWYAAISKGERFTLMLYMPALIALVSAGWLLSRASPRKMPRVIFAAGICIVLIHALIQIAQLLLLPQFSKVLP